MSLARSYEQRLTLEEDDIKPATRASPARSSATYRSTTPKSTPPPVVTPGAPVKASPPAGIRFTRLSPAEMTERRKQGLCFNCPEKFSPEHLKVCPMKGIYLLELDDNMAEPGATLEDLEIWLHALTGTRSSSTMSLTARIGDCKLRALLDSGSTHSFIAESVARAL